MLPKVTKWKFHTVEDCSLEIHEFKEASIREEAFIPTEAFIRKNTVLNILVLEK